uniref:Uncharacterized protein n=1 Tax=Tanacetum cinerariifolium TaxID=118510 RepID=A0A6L2LRM1_TANCI|nr:hypothetical protein [Tanacetum cinerariifolium]
MRDEHLSTIPETESDEVIKSSVENLVLIPNESEVTSDTESECDVSVNDESSLIFTTFSNPLFDYNDDFTFSDDKSLSNEDVSMENFKIYSNPLFDDEEIIFTKIEEAEFDLEKEICFVENLLYDNSSPRPLKELNTEIADTILESLSQSPIPDKDSDSQMKEIDLFLATDDLMPSGIKNDDYDSEGDFHFLEELLSNKVLATEWITLAFWLALIDTEPVPQYILIEQGGPYEDEYMNSYLPQGVSVWEGAEAVHLQAEETKLEYSRNIVTNSRETPSWRGIVSLTVLVKLASFTIAPDLEASRARGFVHRPLELQSFAYGNLIF